MSQKHRLDSYFSPVSSKKSRRNDSLPTDVEVKIGSASISTKDTPAALSESAKPTDHTSSSDDQTDSYPSSLPRSTHPTYPFPVSHLPLSIASSLLASTPAHPGKALNHLPDLDLLYFQPFVPASTAPALFDFLRANLFFYRVKYKIKRGTVETDINTPRFTTVFGVDETSLFDSSSNLIDSKSEKSIEKGRYKTCIPRPLPKCLDDLRQLTEVFTGESYNFCLVNYYATGDDSISYHSDDEKFLGKDPAIASFSLGASRDFLMRHKPQPPSSTSPSSPAQPAQLKLPLASGDMILMRGTTQANWLHSIPKRKSADARKGRINITFRKAIVRGGTENYYRYNVGDGAVYQWDNTRKEMVEWKAD